MTQLAEIKTILESIQTKAARALELLAPSPSPTPKPPAPTLTPKPPAAPLMVWANDGADKVCRQETRRRRGFDVTGPAWNGSAIRLTSAAHETVSAAIVERMVPKVHWEVGVDNLADPTYVHANQSWPSDPAAWSAARRELAGIIDG